MTSATGHPFRFLDLPPELRCRVYEMIEFPTTWHVLERTQALLNTRHWPVPPLKQVYDSRVTLRRPHTPHAAKILVTCHLIYKESPPILKRKVENCRIQPVRYLVDWCAVAALIVPCGLMQSSLGITDGGLSSYATKEVRNFLQTCVLSLTRTRRTQNGSQNGARSIPTIEVTVIEVTVIEVTVIEVTVIEVTVIEVTVIEVTVIEVTVIHTARAVYGKEVLDVLTLLHDITYYSPTRLVLIYKSPLPTIQIFSRSGDRLMMDMSEYEDDLLQSFQKESVTSDRASTGIFVKPLEEEAFEKHVEGLEYY
jgi:hypothetical protein